MNIRFAAAVSILSIVLWPMISDAAPKKTELECELDLFKCADGCDKIKGEKARIECAKSCNKNYVACVNDAAEPELESDGNLNPQRRSPGKLPNVDIQPQ